MERWCHRRLPVPCLCWWTRAYIGDGPGWGCFTGGFSLPSLNIVKPFHVSFVCRNLSVMARQGLCSQVTCTAALPAALPGQNAFMGHSQGRGSAGLAGACSSTSIRFLFKSTPAYFLLLFPKKIKCALIWTWRIILLSLKDPVTLYETQAHEAIAWEPDCPHFPPAGSYCQRFYSLIVTRTSIPRCYGEAQLLKKERKKASKPQIRDSNSS